MAIVDDFPKLGLQPLQPMIPLPSFVLTARHRCPPPVGKASRAEASPGRLGRLWSSPYRLCSARSAPRAHPVGPSPLGDLPHRPCTGFARGEVLLELIPDVRRPLMLAVQQRPYMEVQISKECSTPPTLIAAMSGLEVKREDYDSAEQVNISSLFAFQGRII